jgi:hypothetical protein
MPYTYLQEIVVALSNGHRFFVFIAKTQGQSTCEVSLLLFEQKSGLLKVDIGAMHETESMAFDAAITWIREYLSKHSCQVTSVDSPCNAPFIVPADQATVLRRHQINVTPTVNGGLI